MFNADVLRCDPTAVIDRICDLIRRQVLEEHRRRGVIVAISGGIDSSVVAALCARALGPARVLGLMLPEKDSSDDALRLGTELVDAWGSWSPTMTPDARRVAFISDRSGTPEVWVQEVVLHGEARMRSGESRVFASNHVSWYDVFTLASVLPRYKFVAKAELFAIPVFGAGATFTVTLPRGG